MLRRLLLCFALIVLCAAPAAAQQRIERFPDASAQPAPIQPTIERSSYVVEGILIGAAVGVAAGLLATSDAVVCDSDCDTNGPVFVGVTLFVVAGAAIGFMIGSAIPRS